MLIIESYSGEFDSHRTFHCTCGIVLVLTPGRDCLVFTQQYDRPLDMRLA